MTMSTLTETLDAMRVGDRGWFWFCAEAPDAVVDIAPFSAPGSREALLERARAARVPRGAVTCTGMAAVAGDGALQLGGPSLDAGMLDALAEWVAANAEAHPALQRLVGARLLRINSQGDILERFEDAARWGALRRPPIASSLDAAAAALHALAADAPAWIWMAAGPQGPVVVTRDTGEDPRAEAFAEQLLAARRRAAGLPGLRGVAQRLSGGGLLVMTADPLDRIDAALADWLAGLGAAVRVAQHSGGAVAAVRRFGESGAPLAAQTHALRALQQGTPCRFWFTTADRDGAPALLLESSPQALKALAMEAGSTGASIRGELHPAKWGLELRCRKTPPEDILAQLAGWVTRHHAGCPDLLALVDARLTVRDQDGAVTDRYRDNTTWAPLRALRS